MDILKKLFASLIPGGGIALSIFNFLTSTFGLVLIAASISFLAGYNLRGDMAELDNLKAKLATVQADMKTSEGARIKADKQAASLAANLKKNQERVNALQADLAKRAPSRAACRLSDDDARRLSDIR